MKPPTGDDFDADATADLLEELALAIRSGKLVGLLKGQGLTWGTVEELQWPESVLKLRAILTEHLSRADCSVDEGPDARPGPGKVIAFRKKEGCGS